MTLTVARILGDGTRQRTWAFTHRQSHHLFRDRFGRPGKGSDKGRALVKTARRKFMVPIPNLPFQEWTSVFASVRLTGGLLDRITHHVHILEMNGESYRLKQSRSERKISVTIRPGPRSAGADGAVKAEA